jgi:hypothetical protein
VRNTLAGRTLASDYFRGKVRPHLACTADLRAGESDHDSGSGRAEIDVTTIDASCHCGAVHLEIETPPETVTDCNCSICRRYGVLWAYYSPEHVRIIPTRGATDIYMWDDRSIEFHRCKTCGCVTHWAAVDATVARMGVNARLMDPDVLAAARVRRLDGAVSEKYLDEEN